MSQNKLALQYSFTHIVMGKKDKNRVTYMVLDLGDKQLGDDLGECLAMSCSNLVLVGEMTGIKRDRLTYIFSRLKKSYLYENRCMVIKSLTFYRGKHAGRFANGGYSGWNRN